MGARPLRRAIQRYIEDPLADEVLKTGDIATGSTVMVDRDEKGDEDDKPLKLKIVKPRKKAAPKKKKEPVGVGADGGDDSGDKPDPEDSDK
jgi:ATP-dependent Clp protease ATP-binding subunit ClpC